MENEDKKIIIKDEKGNDIEGTIIFTFEANGDDFILYEVNEQAFAARIDEDGNLSPVNEDEWTLVERIYNEYMEEEEEDE